jgi:hypothetical protein
VYDCPLLAAVSVHVVSAVVAKTLPLRLMRYETALAVSLDGCHESAMRGGSLSPTAVGEPGTLGGMKSALGRPPLSASQSTVPALASAIARANAS